MRLPGSTIFPQIGRIAYQRCLNGTIGPARARWTFRTWTSLVARAPLRSPSGSPLSATIGYSQCLSRTFAAAARSRRAQPQEHSQEVLIYEYRNFTPEAARWISWLFVPSAPLAALFFFSDQLPVNATGSAAYRGSGLRNQGRHNLTRSASAPHFLYLPRDNLGGFPP